MRRVDPVTQDREWLDEAGAPRWSTLAGSFETMASSRADIADVDMMRSTVKSRGEND